MLQEQLAAFQRATLGWRWVLERGKNIVSQARGVACEMVTPFDGSYTAIILIVSVAWLARLAIILLSFCYIVVI